MCLQAIKNKTNKLKKQININKKQPNFPIA